MGSIGVTFAFARLIGVVPGFLSLDRFSGSEGIVLSSPAASVFLRFGLKASDSLRTGKVAMAMARLRCMAKIIVAMVPQVQVTIHAEHRRFACSFRQQWGDLTCQTRC